MGQPVKDWQAKMAAALDAPPGCTKIVLTLQGATPTIVEFTSMRILDRDPAAFSTVADLVVEIQQMERPPISPLIEIEDWTGYAIIKRGESGSRIAVATIQRELQKGHCVETVALLFGLTTEQVKAARDHRL